MPPIINKFNKIALILEILFLEVLIEFLKKIIKIKCLLYFLQLKIIKGMYLMTKIKPKNKEKSL